MKSKKCQNKDFSDFLLSEYEHISNAHFEMTKQVSIFIRYYLILISAPAIIFSTYGKDLLSFKKILTGEDFGLNNYIAVFCLIISIIGVLMCIYIINIKQNGILYARTVNGVRNYFYKNSISVDENSIRVLPINKDVPKYFEKRFLPIVLTFALINSFYFYLFLSIMGLNSCIILYCILFGSSHLFFYLVLSYHRNYIYLKKPEN